MTLRIEETEEGRKITGYLAGDNSWLLPNERVIRTEMYYPYDLPVVNFDTPYWGAVTYVAYTEFLPQLEGGPSGIHAKDMNLSFTISSNPSLPNYGNSGRNTVTVGSSLTSKPKIRGNSSYRPKKGVRCAPGFREINGMCVKQ